MLCCLWPEDTGLNGGVSAFPGQRRPMLELDGNAPAEDSAPLMVNGEQRLPHLVRSYRFAFPHF